MNKISDIWFGRTACQIMPDRYYKDTIVQQKQIEGRILKDWNDRMPNWKPGYDGVYRNDYFYGGNIRGIEKKLPYISSLGFNMIYLTPIEESQSYHHYDVGNHMEIDPWLGNWNDFKNLCAHAKSMGIIIMVDLVFNHTGIKSIYYGKDEYDEWYKKTSTGKQIFWWGFTDLPECDTMNSSYQQSMEKVVEKYLENGASGIRLDLGENLPKEFLYAIGKVREKYPNTIFIGEMWDIATSKSDPKIFDGQLDSVMNYPMADAILRWTRYGCDGHFTYNFNRIYGEYPKNAQNLLLNNISTHDTPTTFTMLGGDKMNSNIFDKKIWDIESPWLQGERFDTYKFREFEAEHDKLPYEQYELAKNLTKVAVAILYTIPGIPCIYQGTEIGDTGYKDPFNRKPYNWKNQDKDMHEFITTMGKYRSANSDILSIANTKILYIDENVLIMERKLGEARIVLAANRTDAKKQIKILDESENLKQILELNGSTSLELAPYGILLAREN